jgi:hypothetical protein
MPPSPDLTEPAALTVLAAFAGVSVADERHATIGAFMDGLAPDLERLRAVPLSFLEPVEPGTALRWIARGGSGPTAPAPS